MEENPSRYPGCRLCVRLGVNFVVDLLRCQCESSILKDGIGIKKNREYCWYGSSFRKGERKTGGGVACGGKVLYRSFVVPGVLADDLGVTLEGDSSCRNNKRDGGSKRTGYCIKDKQ
ncbi:hypothetical protein CEXT_810901 [Caerostris extrusa]|uniref:Uncharacterized protein n=1 Tax=Caerostris extrusa TaxID=172846 RepID=A0AAV4MB14_CAEEX|nr:hypothetical protein CEXT_810901 [Caerostris extrusa]